MCYPTSTLPLLAQSCKALDICVTILVHMYRYGNKTSPVQMRKKSRRREKTIQILKIVALGALLIGIGAGPSPRAIGRIFRELSMSDTKQNRKAIKRKVWELHHRGYIEKTPERYDLSEMGKQLIEREKLWSLKIARPKSWDGMWHIVVFDIPLEKSQVRIPFIRHLQNLGLVFYQRSVWIYPFEIEDEVRQVAKAHDILPFISFIKASHVDSSLDLRKYFKLV